MTERSRLEKKTSLWKSKAFNSTELLMGGEAQRLSALKFLCTRTLFAPAERWRLHSVQFAVAKN